MLCYIQISSKVFDLIYKDFSGFFRGKSFLIFGTFVPQAETLQLKSELSPKTH
ncbi:MAG: hypothetical protein ICV78_02470 [Tolypothrix sp. Co-bin9]|nr:hypothetical protein [Tolypothrix sp. Co-bin9]